MKQKIVYFFFACIFPMGIQAQETVSMDSLKQTVRELSAKVQGMENDAFNQSIWKKRSKYFYAGYMNQTLTHQNIPGSEWKSDFGVSLGFGRTYYLHETPLFSMLKFGIDVTWLDISYAKYTQSAHPEENDMDFDLGMHSAEIGIHAGPSATINPIDHIKLSTYFHFVPSGSIIMANEEVSTGYVPNFAMGGAIAYKAISLGIESRWGKARYDQYSVNEEANEADDLLEVDESRMKSKSLRFYLIFRF